MKPTPEQLRAVQAVIQVIRETIQEMGEAPSGHIYAALMGRLSLTGYQRIIQLLVARGEVRQEPNHLLVWTGPK